MKFPVLPGRQRRTDRGLRLGPIGTSAFHCMIVQSALLVVLFVAIGVAAFIGSCNPALHLFGIAFIVGERDLCWPQGSVDLLDGSSFLTDSPDGTTSSRALKTFSLVTEVRVPSQNLLPVHRRFCRTGYLRPAPSRLHLLGPAAYLGSGGATRRSGSRRRARPAWTGSRSGRWC